jgi:glycosyltransferase involved in cell wall biosynthesis
VLLTVGRLQAPKDYSTLIAALERLRELSVRTRIVGDGPDRATISAAIHDRGLAESVELLGDRDDVETLLASADCFVLSSLSEGLPLSVLEAMATGLPVVASDVGGVHELVVDGVTGALVPPSDPDALAAALQALLADRERGAQLGAAGRARVLADFTVDRFQQAHLDLYRSLV